MFKRRNRKSSRTGCLFVFLQGLIIAGLLLFNGVLVRAFMLANPSVDDIRVTQTVQFVVPLLMLFAELWIYDFLTAKTKEES